MYCVVYPQKKAWTNELKSETIILIVKHEFDKCKEKKDVMWMVIIFPKKSNM